MRASNPLLSPLKEGRITPCADFPTQQTPLSGIFFEERKRRENSNSIKGRTIYRRKPAAVIESKGDELLAILEEKNELLRSLPFATAAIVRNRYKYLLSRDLVYIERVVARPAPNHFVTEFQPTDEIRGFLAALRAGDVDSFLI